MVNKNPRSLSLSLSLSLSPINDLAAPNPFFSLSRFPANLRIEMGEEASLTSTEKIPLSPSAAAGPDRTADDQNLAADPDNKNLNDDVKDAHVDAALRPPSHIRQPEATPTLSSDEKTTADPEPPTPAADSFSIGKYIRDRSNGFSAAIVKRISSLKDGDFAAADDSEAKSPPVTEFHLSGLKVIVRLKEDRDDADADEYGVAEIKGRISFFSRSGCRDCGAVRSFLRERGLAYVEINVDVFPEREGELVDRTGSGAVPAIFFNEKLVGGLVALNSLRNSGEFEGRLREMAGRRCPPEAAPRVPAYGFDWEGSEVGRRRDEMVGLVRVLRERIPVQDRITRMKLVRSCFSGSEMVEAVIHHLDCGRKKAVEVGKELARKHFIHHVFRENDFEDGNNQFYRFLEHDPAISKCFNFRESINDDEPKPAAEVGKCLTKLMSAILEAYASDDRHHLDYSRISTSEEFRRYVNLVQDLQRVDVFALSPDEKTAFFLNLYNAMVIHAVIRVGVPGVIDRRAFINDFQYIVGGYSYSLSTIKNGILRSNRRAPLSLVKPFGAGDRRLEMVVQKVNPLIHFGLCNGTRSSPTVRFFSAQGVEPELRYATREFFLDGGVVVDLEKRTVHLTRIIKGYSIDFGQDKDILKWILNYLDATKAGLLTHLLNDGGPVNIAYQSFDWSLNA